MWNSKISPENPSYFIWKIVAVSNKVQKPLLTPMFFSFFPIKRQWQFNLNLYLCWLTSKKFFSRVKVCEHLSLDCYQSFCYNHYMQFFTNVVSFVRDANFNNSCLFELNAPCKPKETKCFCSFGVRHCD